MDNWIRKFVDKYNEIENISPDVIRSCYHVCFGHFPQGFRHFVSDHLFIYEKLTTKTFEDSRFNFILVYRSTPFRFNVDFYLDIVFIDVGLLNEQSNYPYFIPMGKYSISDFLYGFVSGLELEEIQSTENQSYDVDDDQFEIPF